MHYIFYKYTYLYIIDVNSSQMKNFFSITTWDYRFIFLTSLIIELLNVSAFSWLNLILFVVLAHIL